MKEMDYQKQKKPHSICVPRLYKESAKIRKRVKEGEGLKDLVFNCNHPNPRGIYALVCNSVKNDSLLEEVFKDTDFLDARMDPDLAKILVTELLWGKKTLLGDSKPVQRALQFHSALLKAVESAQMPATLSIVVKPRCVRINTLKTTAISTIKLLVDDGWEQVETPDTYASYIKGISSLDEKQFIQDYHFDDVLMFHPKSELYNYRFVENGYLILQDKASCLPTRLLNPEPGSTVLDMCAAPGIKTAHLAALMDNKGTLYAVDIKPRRYETMSHHIEKFCGIHSCVKMSCADAVHITAEQFPGVQYILVDPTCSGTGMTDRIENSNDTRSTMNSKRIKHLAGYQERLLIQALTAFPDVERVVYSTCSVLQEENEEILEKVLARVPSFHVVAPTLVKHWKHRGDPKYPFGSSCFVADYENDRTNGFFVAVLERIVEATPSKQKQLKRKSSDPSEEWQFPRKKTKNTKKEKMDTSVDDEKGENQD